MMRKIALAGVACILWPQAASANDVAPADAVATRDDPSIRSDTIVVTASRTEEFAGTKTETPLIETTQPITVITDDVFRAQGAINISDTVRYAAAVTANPYGSDSSRDGLRTLCIPALL